MLYEDIGATLVKHAREKQEKQLGLKQQFAKMKFYQDCGFNVMVFGVGSKREILNAYVKE